MSAAVLETPHYQPAAEFTRWLDLNKRALIARWWECTTALAIAGEKLEVTPSGFAFEEFCRVQFDLHRDPPRRVLVDLDELPDSFFDDDKREDPEPAERVDPQTGFLEE